MQEIYYDLFKFFLAIVFGGLIGLERELKGKPAGFRTNILICLGSTLYMILSMKIAGDPGRIAAQVVTGIGFIGAGTIIQARGHYNWFNDGSYNLRGRINRSCYWVKSNHPRNDIHRFGFNCVNFAFNF